MNEQKQQIVIAEACGLENIKPVVIKNVQFQGDDRFCGITSDTGWIPDYLHDLNACHEMEKTLDLFQLQDMGHVLFDHIPTPRFHATAAQRCEAFLKTIGKWVEE